MGGAWDAQNACWGLKGTPRRCLYNCHILYLWKFLGKCLLNQLKIELRRRTIFADDCSLPAAPTVLQIKNGVLAISDDDMVEIMAMWPS